MAERSGVEIDYCPRCRGVWLDRGELDKIIERAEGAAAPPSSTYVPERERPDYEPYSDYERRYEYGDPRRRKRRGFLGDLFDFD